MVTQVTKLSLSTKRESLARIHGRSQRAVRPHKKRIRTEFCATCGHHRKAALRLLNHPLRTAPPKRFYRKTPQTPYQRLLTSPAIPEATKPKLQAEAATLDPFAVKKSIEAVRKKLFSALGKLDRESIGRSVHHSAILANARRSATAVHSGARAPTTSQ